MGVAHQAGLRLVRRAQAELAGDAARALGEERLPGGGVGVLALPDKIFVLADLPIGEGTDGTVTGTARAVGNTEVAGALSDAGITDGRRLPAPGAGTSI